MYRRRVAIVVLYVLWWQAVAAKIDFTAYNLQNGLHVILSENHSSPLVAVSVLYRVGSKNEDTAQTGFTRYFQRLLFNGSAHTSRDGFTRIIRTHGGQTSVQTDRDRTIFMDVLPSAELATGLWIESERMHYATIDSVGVSHAKKYSILEKSKLLDNTAYGGLLNAVYANQFLHHPYRIPSIARQEGADKATVADFMSFYKSFYVPGNAVLVISGDFVTDTAQRLIAQYFGGIPPAAPVPGNTVKEPKQTGARTAVIYDNVQFPAVAIAYRMPVYGTEDYCALELLRVALSEGRGSTMYRLLVGEQKSALEITSSAPINEDPGTLVFIGVCNAETDTAALKKAMLDEVDRMSKDGMTEAEYEEAVNRLELARTIENQKNAVTAENMATYFAYFNNSDLVNSLPGMYRKITRKKIMEVARRYFDKDNRTIVYCYPNTAGGGGAKNGRTRFKMK